MTTDNLTLTFEPATFSKKTMNASSAAGNPIDKKVTKNMQPHSLRPTKSVKKITSLKQAYSKLK